MEFFLIGYFKIVSSVPIIVNYLYKYHLPKKDSIKKIGIFSKDVKSISKINDKENSDITIEKQNQIDKVNIYLNYEWIALYSLSQFENEKWISFISKWIFDENPLIQELVAVNLGIFFPKKYLSFFSKIFYSSESFLGKNIRYAILWLFARTQNEDLIYILTNKGEEK